MPSVEYVIALLENTLKNIKEADSQSDFDWVCAGLQKVISKWPKILDENGSL